jgi:hypothetical protein
VHYLAFSNSSDLFIAQLVMYNAGIQVERQFGSVKFAVSTTLLTSQDLTHGIVMTVICSSIDDPVYCVGVSIVVVVSPCRPEPHRYGSFSTYLCNALPILQDRAFGVQVSSIWCSSQQQKSCLSFGTPGTEWIVIVVAEMTDLLRPNPSKRWPSVVCLAQQLWLSSVYLQVKYIVPTWPI